MSSEDDPLANALADLPSGDVDVMVARRIRGRARALLESERHWLDRPALGRAARIYSRAVEPTLVAGACVIYLYWAFNVTFALLR